MTTNQPHVVEAALSANVYRQTRRGGGPGVEVSEGGVFDTQSELLDRTNEVDQGDYGPLAVADGLVTVYQGAGVDPMQRTNTVIGQTDAHVVHICGGFDEEDLE